MINEINVNVNGWYTEGFQFSTPSPLEVVSSGGKVDFILKDGSVTSYEYDAFTFDVEADPDFLVIYDVYLLENNTVYVDRTVSPHEAFYEGTTPLVHTLATFQVPSGTTNLEDVEILVRKVTNVEEN